MRNESGNPTPRQLQTRAYKEMLAVLGVDQRSELARLVGELAVTRSPDFARAGVTIDRTLSESQVVAIRAIHVRVGREVHECYEAMKQEVLKHQQPGVQHVFGTVDDPKDEEDDAGMILLNVAIEELSLTATLATLQAADDV